MGLNLGNIIKTVIMIIVTLTIAQVLDGPTFEIVDNVTNEGFTGVLILGLVKSLYWLLITTAIVLEMITGFGVMGKFKEMKRMNF